jgi:hypothetical protein
LGDLNANNALQANDVATFEQVLYSQNAQFNAAADANADGLVDNRDLFALENAYVPNGADQAAVAAYESLLLRRGDFNNDNATDAADLAMLYAGLGGNDWLLDVDGNGTVELADAQQFVTQLVRTSPGDYNLDGVVDAADYTVWRDGQLALTADGDFDGDTDGDDYDTWRANFGAARIPLMLAGGPQAAQAAPEPASLTALLSAVMMCAALRSRAGRAMR